MVVCRISCASETQRRSVNEIETTLLQIMRPTMPGGSHCRRRTGRSLDFPGSCECHEPTPLVMELIVGGHRVAARKSNPRRRYPANSNFVLARGILVVMENLRCVIRPVRAGGRARMVVNVNIVPDIVQEGLFRRSPAVNLRTSCRQVPQIRRWLASGSTWKTVRWTHRSDFNV